MDMPSLGSASLVRQLGRWRSESNGDAAYRQLGQALRLLILDGRIGLGVRLPGERELAQALGLSRTTLASAYNQLRDEGYLVSRQGSGSITRIPGGRHVAADTHEDAGQGEMLDWTAAALPAPETVWHAYEDALHQMPAYLTGLGYDALGVARLRQAVAEDYVRRGCPTRPEQIMITNGAQHGFALMLRLLAGPGDRIVVDHPTYHNALAAIRRTSCVPVPVGLPGSGWDIDAIHAAFRQTGPRLAYIIADYHNPTGRDMDAGTRAALVTVAERTRTPLVVDETMVGIGFEHEPPLPVAVHDRAGTTVVSIGSASKRYWGGLRIGWIRADEQMIAALGRIRATLDMATPVMEQLAAATLIRSDAGTGGDAVRRAMLLRRRDRLHAALERHLPHWHVPLPAGGLSLWAEMPRPEASALAAMAQGEGLRIAPGPRFGLDGAFERFVRLPYTLPEDVLDRAVERLARVDARLHRRMPRGADTAAWALEAERVI
ncbi:MAG: DNA-binding transcriptional regulator [Sphingobium sp.]|nr:MAG: DNA-binding transcriptional regulator [Sphingobium sp.]